MTATNERQILSELREIVRDIIGYDIDDEVEFTPELSLLFDVGLESVEFVALLEQLHKRYAFPVERVIRTTDTRAELTDLRVGDVVAFVMTPGAAAEAV